MNFIGTEMETGITQIRAIARIFRRKIVKSIVRSAIFMTMSIAVGVMLGLIIYMLSAILDFSITILIFIAFSALISICLGIRYAYNQAVDEYFRRIVMLRGYWNRFVFIFEFYDDYGYRYIRRSADPDNTNPKEIICFLKNS